MSNHQPSHTSLCIPGMILKHSLIQPFIKALCQQKYQHSYLCKVLDFGK